MGGGGGGSEPRTGIIYMYYKYRYINTVDYIYTQRYNDTGTSITIMEGVGPPRLPTLQHSVRPSALGGPF